MREASAPGPRGQMIIHRFSSKHLLTTPFPRNNVIHINKLKEENFLQHIHPGFEQNRRKPSTEIQMTISVKHTENCNDFVITPFIQGGV